MHMKTLKTISFASTLLTLLLACAQEPIPEEDDDRERAAEEAIKNLKPRDFEIIVIDRCEYLFYTESFGGAQQDMVLCLTKAIV